MVDVEEEVEKKKKMIETENLMVQGGEHCRSMMDLVLVETISHLCEQPLKNSAIPN